MSKAEEFIQDCTKNCSNEIIGGGWNNGEFVQMFNPWLTLDQAKKAVEIAREEVIEQTVEWLTKHAKKYYFNKERYLGTEELVEDYKLIMSIKDE